MQWLLKGILQCYQFFHQVAEQGGFVLPPSDQSAIVLRNPAMPHVSTMLDNVLALVR